MCITGGIQPKVLRRILTRITSSADCLRGSFSLILRFALTSGVRQPSPENIRKAALELFDELWLLQPERDEDDKSNPSAPARCRRESRVRCVLQRVLVLPRSKLTSTKKRPGASSAATLRDSRLSANWRAIHARRKSPATPCSAACDLARWSGNEAVRIYAELAETREQREQRELCEFIERRGGTVTRARRNAVLHAAQKPSKRKPKARLNELVKAGRGKWADAVPTMEQAANAENFSYLGRLHLHNSAFYEGKRKIS